MSKAVRIIRTGSSAAASRPRTPRQLHWGSGESAALVLMVDDPNRRAWVSTDRYRCWFRLAGLDVSSLSLSERLTIRVTAYLDAKHRDEDVDQYWVGKSLANDLRQALHHDGFRIIEVDSAVGWLPSAWVLELRDSGPLGEALETLLPRHPVRVPQERHPGHRRCHAPGPSGLLPPAVGR